MSYEIHNGDCLEVMRRLPEASVDGTTLAVAKRLRRNGIGIDIRESQCDLARRRLEQETPMLEGFV